MKKIRLEKSNSNTQALSQKRSSLNQESLTMSVKPDWRGPSPNIENNNSSKAFFQNMKAELSNIKNDFEKLIRKEISLKPNHDPLKIVNSNKQKQYSSAKKDHRSTSEYQRYQFNHFQKESDDSFARILNLEKNLPCSSQQKQIISKTVQLRDEKPTTTDFKSFDLKQPTNIIQEPQPKKNQVDEPFMLKEAIKQLESELSKQKKVASKLSDEIKLLSDEKLQLIVHVSELNKQLTTKNECILQNERDINQMRNAIKSLEMQRQGILSGEANWLNQKNYLNQQLQELALHHQQLRVIHHRVMGENDHLRDQIQGMQRYCEDLQARCAQIEGDYKRKLQYLQKDLQQYQKREDMFTTEIEKLTQQISSQPKESLREPAIASQSELQQTMANLKDEICHLNRQLQIEKQLHSELAKRYEHQIADTNNTTDLIKAFQEKNTELVDENGKLKTKINYIQSSLDSLSQQNKCYLEQIRLYEERQKQQEERKRLNPTEWEEMTEEIERLKENNQRLAEELEYKLIEKENHPYQSPVAQELLKLTHQQISQLENLKQELKYHQESEYILTRELQNLKAQSVRCKQRDSCQIGALQRQLLRREQQIKSLKNIIFSVIVKKAEKREYQDDIQHILRQIQTIRNSWV